MKMLKKEEAARRSPEGPAARRSEVRRWSARLLPWWRPGPELPPVLMAQYTKPGSRRTAVLLLVLLGVLCFVYGFLFAAMAPARMVQFFFPILMVGALAVWSLPEFGKAPTTAIERLFMVFFVCLPLWPNYLAIVPPGLPWITVARVVGFPLVFLFLLSISVSAPFRTEVRRTLDAAPSLWKWVAAFAIYQTLTVALSNAPQISINKLLAAQVNWIAMFFIAAFVFTRRGRVERWALLLLFMGVALSLLGVREFMERKVLWAGHIPDFLAVEDESVQRVMSGRTRAGTDRYRVLMTFSTALGFGEFLALCTPFALHFLLGAYRFALRVAAAITLPLLLYAIILTDTRLGMVGFLMSCGLYVFFFGALRWRQNRRSILGPAIVLGYPAFAAAFGAAILLVPRLRVMTLGGGKHQASTEARVEQVAQGIPMVFRNPFGHGIGRGAEALGFTSPGGGMTIDTHWLLTALDYGIPGFILFYGIFVIGIVQGFRTIVAGTRTREQAMLVPLVIALFVYVVIKAIYAGVENQSMVFMMLGAVAALIYSTREAQGGEAPGSNSRSRTLA